MFASLLLTLALGAGAHLDPAPPIATTTVVSTVPYSSITVTPGATVTFSFAVTNAPNKEGTVDVYDTETSFFLCSGGFFNGVGSCTVNVSQFPAQPTYPWYTNHLIIAKYEGAPGYSSSSGMIEFTLVAAGAFPVPVPVPAPVALPVTAVAPTPLQQLRHSIGARFPLGYRRPGG